jgi:hypothetical protein
MERPHRTKKKVILDFDTPNGEHRPPIPEATPVARALAPPKPLCPFCYQPGFHRSAAQCLSALDRDALK